MANLEVESGNQPPEKPTQAQEDFEKQLKEAERQMEVQDPNAKAPEAEKNASVRQESEASASDKIKGEKGTEEEHKEGKESKEDKDAKNLDKELSKMKGNLEGLKGDIEGLSDKEKGEVNSVANLSKTIEKLIILPAMVIGGVAVASLMGPEKFQEINEALKNFANANAGSILAALGAIVSTGLYLTVGRDMIQNYKTGKPVSGYSFEEMHKQVGDQVNFDKSPEVKQEALLEKAHGEAIEEDEKRKQAKEEGRRYVEERPKLPKRKSFL